MNYQVVLEWEFVLDALSSSARGAMHRQGKDDTREGASATIPVERAI